ncbi:MAG TPA: hypothetical protein VFW11_06805, partial [Cyclobacteriaceae bacterium]|nr:hypothetical protein [Cyclobacteriaceae bacterium]
AQTKKLHEQKAQLNKIRSNLESMISIKTSEAQDKADILKEYAFVNAHHVRGPLARVLGLIYLIELEDKGNPTSEALHKIKKDAQEMDNIIKKINEVIS